MKDIHFKIKEIGVDTTQQWENVLKQAQGHWERFGSDENERPPEIHPPERPRLCRQAFPGNAEPQLRSSGGAELGLRAPGGMLDRLVREMNVQEKILPHTTT